MPHTLKLQNEATEVVHNTWPALVGAVLLATTLACSQPAPQPAPAAPGGFDTYAVDAEQGPPPPAQGGPGGRGPDGRGPDGHRQGPPPPAGGPGGGSGMHMPPGMWWTNPDVIQKINLANDQQKKISDIFQQYRLKLIDADASVRREETIMEPLVQSETPEDSKILAQIDKVAGARAELEKTNARMLLGIRHVLTPEQWKTLQAGHQRQDGHDGPPRHDGGGPPPRRP